MCQMIMRILKALSIYIIIVLAEILIAITIPFRGNPPLDFRELPSFLPIAMGCGLLFMVLYYIRFHK